jgi:hypothetical protein
MLGVLTTSRQACQKGSVILRLTTSLTAVARPSNMGTLRKTLISHFCALDWNGFSLDGPNEGFALFSTASFSGETEGEAEADSPRITSPLAVVQPRSRPKLPFKCTKGLGRNRNAPGPVFLPIPVTSHAAMRNSKRWEHMVEREEEVGLRQQHIYVCKRREVIICSGARYGEPVPCR